MKRALLAAAVILASIPGIRPCAQSEGVFSEGLAVRSHRMASPIRCSIFLDPGHLAVAQGPYLKILDLTTPGEVRLLSTTPMTGNILDMETDGSTLYLAAGSEGMRMVDVSNRLSPRQIGVWKVSYCSSIALNTNHKHLYATLGENTLRTLRVSDPTHIKTLSSWSNSNALFQDLAFVGPILLAAAGPRGIYAFDTSNPNRLVVRSRFDGMETVERLDLVGRTVVAAGTSALGLVGVGVVDYTSWSEPTLTGFKWTGARVFDCLFEAGSVDRVLLALGGLGFSAMDISTGTPEEIGHWFDPAPATYLGPGLSNSQTLLGCGAGGLWSATFETRMEPVLSRLVEGSDAIRSLGSKGNLVFVSTEGRFIEAWDFSDPASPAFLSSMATPETALHIGIWENLMVASCQTTGFFIYDIADPANPILLSGVNPHGSDEGSTQQTDLNGTLLALADGSNGVLLYDISDPVYPRKIENGQWNADQGFVRSVLFAGPSLLWTTQSNKGLVSLNVDLAGTPLKEAGSVLLSETLTGNFCLHETYAYVCTDWGLNILDVENPAKPDNLSSLGQTQGKDVAVWGDILAVCRGQSGLELYDLADPKKPFKTGIFFSPGQAYQSLMTDNGAIVLADVEGGLWSLAPSSCAGPRLLLPCDGIEVPFYSAPLFSWSVGTGVKFRVEVSTDPGFPDKQGKIWRSQGKKGEYLPQPSWTPSSDTWNKIVKHGRGATLYWRVIFVDAAGVKSESETRTFTLG